MINQILQESGIGLDESCKSLNALKPYMAPLGLAWR